MAAPPWPVEAPFWPKDPGLRRGHLPVKFEGKDYLGVVIAPAERAGCRPLVLVCPNYSGLKGFDIRVCEYLARLGYVGLAVDYYGGAFPPDRRNKPEGGKENPGWNDHFFGAFSGMVSWDHDCGRLRRFLEVWRKAGMNIEWVDKKTRPSAIGYCFGGICVLEMLRGGLDFAGLCSFHGLLQTGEDPNPGLCGVVRPEVVPCENKYGKNTTLVIANGTHDHLVPPESIGRFYAEMIPNEIDMIFDNYSFAPHGFALPPGVGEYHERTDRRSTMTMLSLFREIYPHVPQNCVGRNACGTMIPEVNLRAVASGGCGDGLRRSCAVM
mmetsp:Transcript_50298/g.132994  ORF Transcript_50298/g.132994 Transcript_50298/m.132994 type:complete len:324 (+) Transcript_50298:39-1010(+)